ncbi:MAG: hypothetical protein MR350_02805 [Alphaproteobacteria bacterium]|nr:hypothetical protein [Alphaproteobacteria bacterium]
MKKLFAILILCFLTGIATVHAAYQRHQKQPNFFMPTGALQNTVDKPNFKPVYRQQAKNTAAKQTAATSANQTANTKNQSAPLTPLTTAKEKNIEQTPIAAPKPSKKKTIEPAKSVLPDSAVAQIQKETASPIPVDQTADDDYSEASSNDMDSLYTQSFREYAQDLSQISKGENVQNPRLQKNLSAFQDKTHQITVQ